MPYAFFHEHYPEVADRETRTITILKGSPCDLPPARYALMEMYCDEGGCDCRRVFSQSFHHGVSESRRL